MSGIIKPPVTPIWADDVAPGPSADLTQPADAFIKAGWVHGSGGPQRGYFNWLLNFCANAVRYFSRRGLTADWDAAEAYLPGDVTRDTTDGTLYRCMISPAAVGTQPHADRVHWSRYMPVTPQGAPTGKKGGNWRQNFQSNESLSGTSGSASTMLVPGQWASDITQTSGNAFVVFDIHASISDSQRTVSISASLGAADKVCLAQLHWETLFSDNATITMEWDAAVHVAGANGSDVWMGLGDGGPTRAFNAAFLAFVKRAGDTNWQVNTKDGTTASAFIDTGVPPVADTLQRFRIVFVGANMAAAKTTLFYINDQLVATRTTNLPAAAGGTGVQQFWGVINNGATAMPIYVGDVLYDVDRIA